MTRIKLTKEAGGHTTGTELDTTPGAADTLIASGYAEPIESKPEPKRRGTKTQTDTEGGDTSPGD